MAIRVGINGLGRIGRGFLRSTWDDPGFAIAAVNDVAAPPILAHLLKHDSLYGTFDQGVAAEEGALTIGGRVVRCFGESDPERIPWGRHQVDVVLECTGRFTRRAAAARHLSGGAGRVVISSPSPDADRTICCGVNDEVYDAERHKVISSASCTTHAVAVLLRVVEESFGVERAAMTTIHCVTNNQALVDAPHLDPRRARGALLSMIPTTTTAAEAVVAVLPALQGRLQMLAVRVPTSGVSLVDLTVFLRRPAGIQAAREAFRGAAAGRLTGILGWCDEPLVSSDFLGDTRSAVIDGPLLDVADGRWLKILAWYDNERGYVERLADLVRRIARPGS
jgi:glyceraldehyde 3-phosphate dehydrogenase